MTSLCRNIARLNPEHTILTSGARHGIRGVAHLGSNAERPAERRMRPATSWPRYRVVGPSTQVGAATRGYQSVTRKRGHNAFAPAVIFDFESRASDREFVDDAAYIHLEIEALHRRAREMPGQTARGGCAQSDDDWEPHTN